MDIVKHSSPKTDFDLIVIGAGSGGLNIASFMNRIGLSVLLIDKRDEAIGGDCLNFGCIPSKALLHVAREVAAARRSTDYGLAVGGEVVWGRVKQYIRDTQAVIREHENAAWFRAQGMTVVLGEAVFVGPRQVRVAGTAYTGKRIVLATGSRPRPVSVLGIEQVTNLYTNETIFAMPTLPPRLLILGGGPIGIEMAQAFARLGSRVTVADPNPRILGKEDAEMAAIITNCLATEGVQFLLEHSLARFSAPDTAVFTTPNGTEVEQTFDAVLVAIGRIPNTENLGLAAAGIKTNDRGRLVVDRYLRTTNKRVLVCGDVAGNFQFTHAAEMHATTIIRNFFAPWPRPFTGGGISWVTFTDPELATFGSQEAQLRAAGIPYEVLVTSAVRDDRAITDNYRYARQKLFVSKKGKILGGTMVAPQAGELIQELVLAQQNGLSLARLFQKTYAYPVAARINKRAAGTFMAGKLTAWRARLLRMLY
jgi:pyruvate/2-oxoglutarate dehydrogenase complex dihydrolipoamide dehydrogenase (E3) component